jgi:putative membrane protein
MQTPRILTASGVLVLSGLLLAVAHTSTAVAAQTTGSSTTPQGTKHLTSQEFVARASQDGLTQVELGNLALSKSSNDQVKKFAQQMVDDHKAANAELSTIAQAEGIQAPTALDPKHQATVHAMSEKSGPAFDAAYAKAMVSDHSRAIRLFEHGEKLHDTEIASFARKTLPTLQEHKSMAESLQSEVRTASAAEHKTSAR